VTTACTAIIGMSSPNTPHKTLIAPLERLHLVPRDYGFLARTFPGSTSQLVEDMQSVLQGKPSELMQTALWNGGFTCGVVEFAHTLGYSQGGSIY